MYDINNSLQSFMDYNDIDVEYILTSNENEIKGKVKIFKKYEEKLLYIRHKNLDRQINLIRLKKQKIENKEMDCHNNNNISNNKIITMEEKKI